MVNLSYSSMMEEDWRSTHPTLISKLHCLMMSKTLSDVQIAIQTGNNESVFPAHRLILAANSSVFESLAYGQQAKEVICIQNIDVPTVLVMLRYFYTGRVKIESVDDAIKIVHASERFAVHSLLKKCTVYIESHITPENACKIYEYAVERSMASVKTWCKLFFRNNTKEVIESVGFKSSKHSIIRNILQNNCLAVPSESFIFTAVLRWGRAECSRRGHNDLKTVVQTLLPFVEVTFMSPKEVVRLSEAFGIPSDDELDTILSVMHRPFVSKVNLPKSFHCGKEAIKFVDWEGNITRSLSTYQCDPHGKLIEMAGRTLAFRFKVLSEKYFLNGFCLFYKTQGEFPYKVHVACIISVAGRFLKVRFAKSVIISQSYGAIFVYFPRAVFLEANESVDVKVKVIGYPATFQCKVYKTQTVKVPTEQYSSCLVTECADLNTLVPFIIPCVTPSPTAPSRVDFPENKKKKKQKTVK